MTEPNENDRTHFGFSEVPRHEKAAKVAGVFDSVADRYDLMNDLMSFGLHRLWKRFALERTGLRPGQRALDVAAGSGDLAAGMAKQVGPNGQVLVTDINAAMLSRGRERLEDAGVAGNVDFLIADGESLPFAPRSFHCLTVGFGLRNMTNQDAALASMFSVLKPGGRLLVLEFSKPAVEGLAPIYDAYSFSVLPRLGEFVAGDSDSYRYLAESIRRHPDQDTLKSMMEAAGFEQCRYFNLAGGIVALHEGLRL